MFETMRGWIHRNMPREETFQNNRFLRPIAHRVLRPELWRFTRRSVPRGVALGVVVGVLVPVAQTVFAALLALPARANVPVAALTTFLTNPITTPPLWLGGYWLGKWLLRIDAGTPGRPIARHLDSEAVGWLRWLLSDAAPATALGLLVIAIVGAAIGYLLAAVWWRIWIARKWNARAHSRMPRG
jgi:uncharacterized protein (DUF2062 family)